MTPIDPLPKDAVAAETQKLVLDIPAEVTPDGDVITKWELDDEDRARLAAGGHIWIAVKTLGNPFQPLLVTTEPLVEAGAEAEEDERPTPWPQALIDAPCAIAPEEPLEDCEEAD